MDGLKLYLHKSPHQSIQEMFYNGWKVDHYVTYVFVFVPDGTISIAFFNVPGCVHDSQVAIWGGIYNKLEPVYKSNGVVCVVNSAFGKIIQQFLIKSSQDYLCSDETELLNAQKDIQTKGATTSIGQAAEGGMQASNLLFLE